MSTAYNSQYPKAQSSLMNLKLVNIEAQGLRFSKSTAQKKMRGNKNKIAANASLERYKEK